jgi:hypothetical protein
VARLWQILKAIDESEADQRLFLSAKLIVMGCRFWWKLVTGTRIGNFGMTIPRTTPVRGTSVKRSEII